MKTRFSLVTLAAVLLLVLGLTLACSRARTDAQIASDVQSKIGADNSVQSRQYTVQAANGVITLSGNVNSDAERSAAANDAASVEGVKTVVNNLQVAPSQEAAATNPEPQPEPESAAAPSAPARRRPSAGDAGSRRSGQRAYQAPAASGREMASNAPTGFNDEQPLPSRPAAPVTVTIPEGTTLAVRLVDNLDSERNQAGDTFRASLDSPLYINDRVVIPAQADIQGRVVDVKSAAHFKGSSSLAIELTRLTVNGKSYELHTDQWARQGAARGKNTAEKVGGGAALGALIGGLAGGGKGAAIGAGIGAGAGTGAQAVTHGQQVKLSSEQVLNFRLESPLTVTPVSGSDRNSGRQRLED